MLRRYDSTSLKYDDNRCYLKDCKIEQKNKRPYLETRSCVLGPRLFLDQHGMSRTISNQKSNLNAFVEGFHSHLVLPHS